MPGHRDRASSSSFEASSDEEEDMSEDFSGTESDFRDSEAEEVSDEDIESSDGKFSSEENDEELAFQGGAGVGGDLGESDSDLNSSLDFARRSQPKGKKIARRFATSSSSSEDDAISPIKAKKKKTRKRALSSSSDDDGLEQKEEPAVQPDSKRMAVDYSSEDDSKETCTICLLKLKDQELGKPTICAHVFCAECIIEWSKNVPTCPIDRLAMKSISISKNGEEIRQYRVKVKSLPEVEQELGINQDNPVFDNTCLCETCGSGDREDRMLLCDACDLGYHLECLVPPLHSVPRGRWYCPTCSAAGIPEMRWNAEIDNRRVRSSRTNSGSRRRNVRRESSHDEADAHDNLDGFIVPDDFVEDDQHDEPSYISRQEFQDDDYHPSTDEVEVIPRTARTQRIQRTFESRRRLNASSLGGGSETESPKKKKKVKRKRKTIRRKRTSSTKKKTTRKKQTSSAKKKSTSSTRKRKSTRKKKTSGKGKGKGKGKSSKSSKVESNSSHKELIPRLSLFGSKDDLDFHGDEELFYNSSTQESSKTEKSKQNSRSETSSQEDINFLANIMTSQTKAHASEERTPQKKTSEFYARSPTLSTVSRSPPKPISTSVTKRIFHETKKKTVEVEKKTVVKSPVKRTSFTTRKTTTTTTTTTKTISEPSSSRQDEIEASTSRGSSNSSIRDRLRRIHDMVKVNLREFYNERLIDRNDYREIYKKCVMKVSSAEREMQVDDVRKIVLRYMDLYTQRKSYT